MEHSEYSSKMVSRKSERLQNDSEISQTQCIKPAYLRLKLHSEHTSLVDSTGKVEAEAK